MAKKKVSPKKPKAKAKKSTPKLVAKKGARQVPLPGMEDRAISSLDDAAMSYDEVKKQRMALTEQEVEAKATVSTLMHKLKKTHYKHNGITIDLVPEGEKVKVKIKPEGEDEDDEDPDTEIPDEENEAQENADAAEQEEEDEFDHDHAEAV